MLRSAIALLLLVVGTTVVPSSAAGGPESPATAELRALLARSPKLPLVATDLRPTPPRPNWAIGMVSWVAVDGAGLIYLLQRGDRADPIVVLDANGRVVRSWGKGMYVTPHAIRIDPRGHVWTTDAATSMVYEFTPTGEKVREIAVGGQPSPCRDDFCGTTDIAFAPDGHLLIADGYANARILEYDADGRKLREWGTPGSGPGQFRLPHSIQVDERGTIYVADRENGRVQRFDAEGNYLGEWTIFGKTFSLALQGGALWLATQPRDAPVLSSGWMIEVDRERGDILGYVEVSGAHGMAALPSGEPLVGPGPATVPQWFRVRK